MHRINAMCRAGVAVCGIAGAVAQAAAVTINSDMTTATDSAPVVMEVDDRAAFDASYPHAQRINFAAEAGKTAPFRAGSVRFSGGDAQVLDSLVGLTAASWFGAQATSPDFLLANQTVEVTFHRPMQAIGFDLQCFGCDLPATPTPITAVLLDKEGIVVGYEQVYPNALTGAPAGTPTFLGFDSNVPFTSIVLHRDANWLMANLRYAAGEAARSD